LERRRLRHRELELGGLPVRHDCVPVEKHDTIALLDHEGAFEWRRPS
jgi:hypothetical protein